MKGIIMAKSMGKKVQYVVLTTFFSQLINLKQKGSVTEHIENFQRLIIKVTDIPYDHLIDVFIGTLRDNIKHEVCLWEPKSLENSFRVERNVESKNMAIDTRRTNPNIYRENNSPSSKTPQPTRLTPQQLEERKQKVYALIVTTSIVRDISVVRRDYYT
jgi:hypothetical protein